MTAAPSANSAPPRRCGTCRHFHGEPQEIERLCPGLTAMGSGYASVRAQDGICSYRDVYVLGNDACPAFGAALPAVK
jgi:hypothetical protein